MGNELRSILIVEDDETIRTGLVDYFEAEGYAVTQAADGNLAQRNLTEQRFDLVVLDVMLPGPGGLELLRDLRKRDTATPVILLTARGDENDKVLGLELGADDYVTKPFGLREVGARVKAHLRRSAHAPSSTGPTFAVGTARVDLDAFEVVRDGAKQALSPKEAEILRLLFANAGKVVPRNRILDEVWGPDQYLSNRTIDTHVLNLRQKLEADPKQPKHLRTVHGVGYRLEP